MSWQWRKSYCLIAIGTYELTLPSGLVLNLENCYYVPTICRNIISVSCLEKKDFEFIITNNKCNIYHDNIFYGYAPRTSGLYVLNIKILVKSQSIILNQKKLNLI